MSKDYYNILGVDKGASKEDIKKAYKKLAKKYHPDISKEADAEKKFKEINEAAGVLLDDNKRSQYERTGSADGPQGFGGFSGGGFNPQDFGINLEDIFEQFGFGGFGGGFGSQSRRSQKKDTKVYAEVDLTLEDVYFGVKKELKITRDVKCDTCSGKGAKSSKDVETCSTCGGSGVVIETQRSILGHIRTQRQCSECSGTGKTIKNPCSDCSGKGTVSKKESIEVRIPKGIEDGVTLRVQSKGHFDSQTQDYGDLYLGIHVRKDKEYEVDGYDLHKTLDINFIQAIIGDEVELKHFKKTLSLKIPSGTQSGTTLRLKAKGLPYFNYDGYGDLYLKINVQLPTKTTKEQKNILMEYANTLEDKSFFKKMKDLFN